MRGIYTRYIDTFFFFFFAVSLGSGVIHGVAFSSLLDFLFGRGIIAFEVSKSLRKNRHTSTILVFVSKTCVKFRSTPVPQQLGLLLRVRYAGSVALLQVCIVHYPGLATNIAGNTRK